MGLWERGFVEFLIEKIKKEGIRDTGWSNEERVENVIDMIWEAYYEFNKE